MWKTEPDWINGLKGLGWVDGLKGIACILVFSHHFLVGFYPAAYYGKEYQSHVSFDVYFSQSIVGIILNGNFWVYVFCVLSAIVLSYSLNKNDAFYEKLSNGLLKRYFRLALPVFTISVFVLICKNVWGGFTNVVASEMTGSPWLASYYTNPLTIRDLFLSSFVYVWFTGDDKFSGAFWMLTYIFHGSILTYLLNVISHKRSKKVLWLSVIPLFAYIVLDSLLAAYVLGFLLEKCLIEREYTISNRYIQMVIGGTFVITGLLFGGYPSGVVPTNGYHMISNLPFSISPSGFWHLIGSGLLILGIIICGGVQNVLQIKPLVYLGKLSYAVYLIHIPLLFTAGTSIFMWLMPHLSYNQSALVSYIVTLVMLIGISTLFHVTVEVWCGKLLAKIEKGFGADFV